MLVATRSLAPGPQQGRSAVSYVEVQAFFTWSSSFFAPNGVPIVAPRDLIQDAIMFQLTIVVIEVVWWCWPYNERWYVGDGVEGEVYRANEG